MATDENAPWGRVDDEGTVYVREADGERAVGQYPDATPEEALAYFTHVAQEPPRMYAEEDVMIQIGRVHELAGNPPSSVLEQAFREA